MAATEAGVASSPEIAAHVTNAQETPPLFRPWPWWHLLGLWSLVVAQPLFEVLRQNGDFFVAHRTSPFDLGLFVVVLALALPAILGLAIRSLGVVSVPLARAVHLLAVAGLLAAMASQVVQRVTDLPTWPHVFVSVALGGLVAWGYAQSAALRSCASLLVGAVPVFGAMFLLHPKMEAFVRPFDRTARLAVSVPQGAPPIVMVVFDQLPLSSLLEPDGSIDERHYPGFAALAGDATWFRNATANGEYTGWALPAIMTGVLPRPARLPIAQDHPQNLFTVIGDAYRFDVTEPITRLCPERLCPADDGPVAERLMSMLLDASVVYAHIVAPSDLRGLLPALTDDWRDFAHADQWQGRWVRARDRDRTEPVARFIESISAGDRQPTIYFLHVLLPHEPYVYLRSGQRFSSERIAGMSGERWGADEYLVSLGYQRHLTQLEFVDGVVARLVAKLRNEGLYDKAVLVVTSDHGASFRPGKPWKGLDESNRPDIMGVPLFIKAPGQAGGRVDARNMQAIDVLPTIADLLRVSLRDKVDGVSAVGEPRADTRKTIRHGGATRETVVETAEHERRLMESVARRWSTMIDGVRAVPAGARRELLDTAAPAEGPPSRLTVLLEGPQRFSNVDPRGAVLPLHVSGRAFDSDGRPAKALLAVAVNGTVRALAPTEVSGPGTQDGAWTALLPASALQPGRNLVQVYTTDDGGRGLELAYSSGQRPESLNLSSKTAEQFWGVALAGLYSRERKMGASRWTSGQASLVVPLDVDPRPRSLRVGLGGPPPAGGPVRIRINDCLLHDGRIDGAPWYRTFSLDGCGALHSAAEADIVIESATFKSQDGRPRGLVVETVNLFASPWPPTVAAATGLDARVSIVGAATAVARARPIVAEVANTGHDPWVDTARSSNAELASVALELRWRRLPDGPVDRTQQLRLPRVLYPGDVVRVDVPLVPPPAVDGEGPWDVALVPVAVAGGEARAQAAPTVHVTATRLR